MFVNLIMLTSGDCAACSTTAVESCREPGYPARELDCPDLPIPMLYRKRPTIDGVGEPGYGARNLRQAAACTQSQVHCQPEPYRDTELPQEILSKASQGRF